MVATCTLELSKTSLQAEGDAVAETVDFVRANLANAVSMLGVQPMSSYGVDNHVEYRPLEYGPETDRRPGWLVGSNP